MERKPQYRWFDLQYIRASFSFGHVSVIARHHLRLGGLRQGPNHKCHSANFGCTGHVCDFRSISVWVVHYFCHAIPNNTCRYGKKRRYLVGPACKNEFSLELKMCSSHNESPEIRLCDGSQYLYLLPAYDGLSVTLGLFLDAVTRCSSSMDADSTTFTNYSSSRPLL